MADFLPTPVDKNGRRLVDRGTQPLVDYQTIGATAQDIVVALDVKGFTCIVNTGTLTVRGVEPCSVAYLDAAAVVDNLDGTVDITATGHGFTDGDDITIHGTTYYDGTWEVLAAGDADSLFVTPTATVVNPTAGAVVSAGGGSVDIACSNVFNDGDTVVIAGTTNYNGTYTLNAASTAAKINITAAYVAETLDGTETISGFPTETLAATDYAVGYRDITYAAGESFTFPTAVEAMQPLFVGTGAATIKLLLWR